MKKSLQDGGPRPCRGSQGTSNEFSSHFRDYCSQTTGTTLDAWRRLAEASDSGVCQGYLDLGTATKPLGATWAEWLGAGVII